MASATAVRVLERVRAAGRDGLTPEDLAETLGTPKGSVTRAVNQLTLEDLVRRDGTKVRPVLRRGRRLILTAERDEEAAELIQDAGEAGLSVQDLADKLGIGRGLAYQSIYRLRRLDRIYRVGVTRTARWVTRERAA